MFAIVVNEKGGEQKRLEFDKPEVSIEGPSDASPATTLAVRSQEA